ncbi:MAG: hypothetical protein JKY53_12985 [Flavobacteriales bacterium]|nr:hypothetical protein [Flavobacteriales bacterium]
MNNIATQALSKLFAQGDKLRKGERAATLLLNKRSFPTYLKIKGVSILDETHAAFANAVKHGAITIDWVKFHEGTQVERLRIKNLDNLACFLGADTLATRINNAKEILLSCDDIPPPWLQAIYTRVADKWAEGKKPHHFSPEDAGVMCDLIKLVNYLEPRDNTLDMRTVSVKLYQDTKHIEKCLLGRLTSLYREHLGAGNMNEEEILAEVSLSKYPWPVLIRADLDVTPNEGASIYCGIKPYIGIPPDVIKSIELKGSPAYILTIENFSTFNTYTRLIDDGGIIIYTNGFPNKWFVSFYRDVLSHADRSVPVFHWGDIDVGGFRILAKLQEYAEDFNVVVLPHLMGRLPAYKGKPFTDSERSELGKIEPINYLADKLICTLQEPASIKIEQESIDPVPPIF